MCVIAIVKDERPTAEMLDKMWERNPWGGGLAWRETKGGVPVIRWKKGMQKDEMKDMAKTIPYPNVLHFRVPSNGTSLEDEACHPFPIEEGIGLSLEGETTEAVLFHNGFWGPWKHELKDTAIRGNFKIPDGEWSDSRALAWMAHNLGWGILQFIDEKMCVFPAKGEIRVYKSDAWKRVGTIWVSNELWQTTDSRLPDHYRAPVGMLPGARDIVPSRVPSNGAQGGGSTVTPFRSPHGAHGAVCPQGDRSESLQQGAKGPRGGTEEEETRAVIVSMSETERELISWLHNEILPRERRREAGSQRAPRSEWDKPCSVCGERPTRVMQNGVGTCADCWSAAHNVAVDEQKKTSSGKKKSGWCGFCHINTAQSKTLDTEKWICGTCWKREKQPGIYTTYLVEGEEEKRA